MESSRAFEVRGEDGREMLAGALESPRWHYYPNLEDKAAVLHDRLNSLHPFIDGNKRFALTAMLVFLGRNNALLIASDQELLDFSVSVAAGRLDQADACRFAALRTFQRDWTEEQIASWYGRVDAEQGEGDKIGSALKSWRHRQDPRFVGLPGSDLEALFQLAAPTT